MSRSLRRAEPEVHPPRAWKANMVRWMDHIGLLVSDLARAKNFYGACLAPLGWQFRDDGPRGGVFRNASSPPLYLTPASTDTRGLHLAFRVSSREPVEAFHRAALAQGATDNGPPGCDPTTAMAISPPSSWTRAATTWRRFTAKPSSARRETRPMSRWGRWTATRVPSARAERSGSGAIRARDGGWWPPITSTPRAPAASRGATLVFLPTTSANRLAWLGRNVH